MYLRNVLKRLQLHTRLQAVPILILALYLVLAITYSLVVPIFEAPDEPAHFLYAEDLAEGDGLPVLDYSRSPREYHQPPLYYWLVSGVLRWFDTDGYRLFTVRNPHAAISDASTLGNKNVYVHDPAREGWPFRGLALAVHAARLVSIGLGLVTVWATYQLALHLFSGPSPGARHEVTRSSGATGPAAAAAALVAFNPQFLFISAALNNDNAVTAVSSLALWATVAYYRGPRSIRWLVGLGVLAGLAMLTKTTGLAVLALILGVLAAKALRQGGIGRLWLDAALVLGLAVLIGGWWYARNALLYADPFLSHYMHRWLAGEGAPRTVIGILHRFEQGEISFWGTFGWLSITWDEWIYRVLRTWTRLSGLGLLVLGLGWLVARPADSGRGRSRLAAAPLLISLTWTALIAALLVQWILVAGGLQGRLLFPAISALAVLLVAGWTGLAPRRWASVVAAVPAVGLAALAMATPFTAIAPAYARPAILTSSVLPGGVRPLDLNYAGRAKLIGYQVAPAAARPGERIDVTLYWQVLEAIEEDFSLFVHLFGRDGQRIGTVDTYPGLGSYPTSQWRPGQVIRDVYPVRVAYDAEAPTLVDVSVGWYDFYGSREGIHAVDPSGQPTTTAGTFKLVPAEWPQFEPAYALGANFGNLISLSGYDIQMEAAPVGASQAAPAPGRQLKLTLYWKCQASPRTDLTVFAHLLDEQGNIFAQMDRPPLDGDYPTSAWETGESITDSLIIPLPPLETLRSAGHSGQLRLRVGLYRTVEGTRLPVLNQAGQVVGDAVTSVYPVKLLP
jgi:4-amino-4-deoxy-L-arabinose transferase-like glycosyltransferase